MNSRIVSLLTEMEDWARALGARALSTTHYVDDNGVGVDCLTPAGKVRIAVGLSRARDPEVQVNCPASLLLEAATLSETLTRLIQEDTSSTSADEEVSGPLPSLEEACVAHSAVTVTAPAPVSRNGVMLSLYEQYRQRSLAFEWARATKRSGLTLVGRARSRAEEVLQTLDDFGDGLLSRHDALKLAGALATAARLRVSLTQKAFGEMMGLTQSQIVQFETGRTSPNARAWETVLNALRPRIGEGDYELAQRLGELA